MNYNTILFLGLFICIGSLRAQEIDNFSYLEAKAPIPNILTQTLEERTEDLLKKYSGNEDLQDFVVRSSYSINIFLNSGQIIFNDEITTYMEDIASFILKDKPEVFDELQFFTLRSSVANAFATPQGLIFVTTGLLAQLESEAELAFILAHEISHYTEEHGLDFHYDMEKIGKNKKNNIRKSNSGYQKNLIRHVHKYKKENEFEADLEGLNLLSRTNYDLSAIENSFYILLYSYLPIEERRFDKSLMTDENLIIPDEVLYSNYKDVTQIEDYDDSESTHPNIKKRIDQTAKELENLGHSGTELFIIGEERFKNTQTLARLSIINSYMVEKKYFRALYHLNMMKRDLKDNYFMDLAEIKLYYGMLCYMNSYHWDLLLELEENCEGELSYLVNYFENISKEGLSTLSVYKAVKAIKKYPDDELIQEYMDLIGEETKKYSLLNYNDFIPNEQKSDYQNEEDDDDNRDTGELEDYFITAFSKSEIENLLPNFFDGGEDEIKEDFNAPKEGKSKKLHYLYPKYPAGNMDKITLINPQFIQIGKKNKGLRLEKGAAKSSLLLENIDLLNTNEDFKTLDYKQLTENNIEKYNQLGFTQMWMEDINSYYDKFSMRSCLKEKMLEVKASQGIDKITTLYMIQTPAFNPYIYSGSDAFILINSAALYSYFLDRIISRNSIFTLSNSYDIDKSSIHYSYYKVLKEPYSQYILRSELTKFKNTLNKK